MNRLLKDSLLWPFRALTACALWTFWVLLLLLAAYQVRTLATGDFSIPRLAVLLLEKHLERQGVRLEFQSAFILPSGEWRVESPVLSTAQGNARLLSASHIRGNIDWRQLLLGRPNIRHIEAAGIKAGLPAMFSSGGENETVLDSLDLCLLSSGHTVELPVLRGTARTLHFDINGSIRLPGGLDELLRGGGGKKFLPAYTETMRLVSDALKTLDGLDSPRLIADLREMDNDNGTIARLKIFSAGTTNFPAWKGLKSAGPVLVTAETPVHWQNTGGKNKWLLGKSSARIALDWAHIEVPGVFSARVDDFDCRLDDFSKWHETPFFGTFGKVEWLEKSLGSGGLVIEGKMLGKTELAVAMRGLWADDVTMRVLAQGDFIKGKGSARIGTELSDGVLLAVEKIAALPPLAPFLRFDSQNHAKLEATLALQSGQPPSIQNTRVHGEQVWIYGVTIDELESDVKWDGQNLLCENALARLGPSLAQGSFSLDTKNLAYRFLLRGHLQPMDIKPWFGPWWGKIWEHFAFPSRLAEADVDVRGRFKTKGEGTEVYIGADARDAVVEDIKMDRVRTYLRVEVPSSVNVLFARAEIEKRKIEGRFLLQKNPENLRWDRRAEFDITSTLNLSGMQVKHCPAALQKIWQKFEFAEGPLISAHGWLEDFTRLEKLKCQVAFRVESPSTAKLYGASFASFIANGNLTGKTLALATNILDGNSTAILTLHGKQKDRLSLNLTAEKIKLAHLDHAIASAQKQKSKEWLQGDHLFLSLQAEGPFNNIFAFDGNGTLEMHADELGKINLLGSLSEALRGTAFNLGGIVLRDLKGNFTLQKDIAEFEKVEITGPSALIDLHGALDLRKKLVNMKAKLYPLDKQHFLISNTIGILTAPLSNILEVRVQGSMDKPSWFFTRGPTNLIKQFSPASETGLPPLKETPSTPDKTPALKGSKTR